MLGLVLTAVVVVAIAAVVVSFLASQPTRVARRKMRLRAELTGNHQDLFLLVRDLLALQEHGQVSIFPDTDTLERARKLTYSYREEIGP